MCKQIDYAIATLNPAAVAAAATQATIQTTTTTTSTTTSNKICICCYQLKPSSYGNSSSQPANSKTIATTKNNSKAAIITTNCQHNLWHILVIFTTVLVIFEQCLLLTQAAPQSCILCDINDLKARAEHAPGTSYEEYLFEHQVTRQDAINALKLLNDSYYEGPSKEQSCKAVTCTNTVMKYCLSPQFINDHCWCELGHTEEGLPFIPHICYVGEKTYTASVGSCFFYEEVKECCCAPALAKQWRHISEASHTKSIPNGLLILLLLLPAGWRIASFSKTMFL